MSVVAAAPPSPYKGLTPFDESDVDAFLFFGREREREVIVANLLASRLTVLYGPSGVGKSSLLKAGVAHRLRGEGFNVVVYSAWVDDPVAGLVEAMGHGSATTLTEAVEAAGEETFVILDQFEEYFLYHGRDDVFSWDLAELLARPLRVSFLVSLREDALARLDAFNGRIPNLFGNYLRLDRLDRSAGRDAVVGPVARWNTLVPESERVTLEPELVEAVLDEVEAGKLDVGEGVSGHGETAAGGIEAPYLQLVLQRLWDEERDAASKTLRLATFRRLGGAEQIVREHLERALDALTPGQKDVAANLFRHLVTPSGTKIAHDLTDLADYAAVREAELAPVLSALGRERILRPVGGDGAGIERYEIFHDVLGAAVLEWRGRRELERQREEAERRHRRTLTVAAAALAALAVVAAVAVFALVQRSHARADARRAHARELTAHAVQALPLDPRRAIADAVTAASLEQTQPVEDVLRQSLAVSQLRVVFDGGGRALAGATYSPYGELIATAGADGVARVFGSRTRRLVGLLRHRDKVTHVAFGSGNRLVTASDDGTVRIWQPERPPRILRAGARLADVALSPDGRLVAAAGYDRRARIWRERDGRLLRVFSHPQRVLHVLFSPDGGRLLTLDYDRRAREWDLRRGDLLHVFTHFGYVNAAAYSADGRYVVTVDQGGVAKIWHARDGHLARALEGVDNPLDAVAFSPDGTLVATGSTDGLARLYVAATGVRLGLANGHTNFVTGVAFSPDSRLLLTTSPDKTARIWSADRVDAGKLLATLAAHDDTVTGAAFSPDGLHVLTASADGAARVWSAGTEPEFQVLGRVEGSPAIAAVSPDGRWIAGAGDNGVVRVWNRGGGLVRTLRSGGERMSVVAFAPDSRTLLTGNTGGRVDLWRVRDGRQIARLDRRHPVAAAAFTPDGHRVVVAAGRDLLIIDPRSGALTRAVHEYSEVASVAASADSFAVGGTDGRARIRSEDGDLVRILRGHNRSIVAIRFSPDGTLLATASKDATAGIWRVDTGTRVHLIRGHTAGLTSVRFSPDGRRVVTTGEDADVRVWSVANGRQLYLLRGHFHYVSDASFSPDGRWILTAGPRTVGLWSSATGRLFSPSGLVFAPFLRGPATPITTAVWGPDSRTIVAASGDGAVRTYACDLCGRIPQLVALARARLRQTARGR